MKLKSWPITAKEALLFLGFFLFSSLLMFKTFRLSPEGNMQIATKAWSDFAATIPLIRSFSYGSNFPPEYPIFSGYPIRYHFVFYLLVGFIEKLGFPINWALNLPSIFGFTLLLIIIYLLGKHIFKSKAVGILSSVFFLFNGSLSFLEFFKTHPFSADTFSEILHNKTFPSFGPYDGKIVSAFWNLNIFTNQRHLALAYASFLLVLFVIFRFSQRPKTFSPVKALLLGIFVGIFPFIHLAVFAMLGILLLSSFFLYEKIRLKIFLAGTISLLLAIPQVLYMGASQIETKIVSPGYLIGELTLNSFIKYWFYNLGLLVILAPVGFILSNKSQRKVLLPFLVLFIIGNIFQLSPEIAANHKFFNLFAIGLILFVSFSLVKLWRLNLFGKFLFPILIFFTVLSGIIDFFPIINDSYVTLEDIPNNKAALFIKQATPKNSVFLNSSFLYHPASIAGRKILMGWPYFPWSAGYNTDIRGKLMTRIYESKSKAEICGLLVQNNVDYFTIQDTSSDRDFPEIDLDFFNNNFTSDYSDPKMAIINVYRNCSS